jgi:uncharacterized protein (DUF305 family)
LGVKGGFAVFKKTATVGVAIGAALLIATGCSNSADQAGPTTSGVSASGSASETHNQADVMFAQHMIPHHQQAIEMSDMMLDKQGIDPRVTDLANKIKAAQGPEIETMQGWLTEWGVPTMAPMMPPSMPHNGMPDQSPPPSPTDPHHGDTTAPGPPSSRSGMPGPGGMAGMGPMQGMMSDQDMAALQNAQGVEASKLFLTQMIRHHQGAITMGQQEIDTGRYPDAVSMAQSIVTSQQEEIKTMQDLLNSL